MKSIPYIIGLLTLTTGLFSSIDYRQTAEIIANKEVVHHVLDIDMNDPAIEIGHGLSEGVLYGFETTSGILAREGALHGVNGLFYDDFGMPYGTLFEKGEPIRMRHLNTPSLLIGEDNQVAIADNTVTGYVYIGEGYAWLYGVNSNVPDGMWVLFDENYGSTTRVRRQSTNYIIENGRVTDILYTDQPVQLSLGDQVLTYVGESEAFAVGDQVRYVYQHSYQDFKVDTTFQTGGWVVKDGVNVAQPYDGFVGYTTAPQPRTLVGVTQDNHLLFVVVDGRQQGYSIGVSGPSAAELMLSYGCIDAAYLDGGSSSTMVYNGELVSKPSRGEERKVAHAIVIKEVKVIE